MENTFVDNRICLNEKRIGNIIKLTIRCMDQLIAQADEGVLKNIKTPEALDAFNAQMKDIITQKLRNKFGI